MSSLRRYLERYAEPIAGWFEAQVQAKLSRAYQFVLVIPAYDEPLDCLECLLPPDLHHALIILVVNASEEEDCQAIQRSQALLHHLGGGGEPLTIVPLRPDTDLLLVDCCTPGRQLPKKQGVGLARKIGADLALVCIEQQVVASPWIYCTDADVRLPLGYFKNEDLGEDVAVAIYPFTHQPPHRNILLYELSLRYYVTQLNRAASPYGFHTIGSLLKISAFHYVKVRGFPLRKAAEDFYMLNKLAKTGKVVRLRAPKISLSSRISSRVPFGTGAALLKMAKGPDLGFYDPEIFAYLRLWLDRVEYLWCDRTQIGQLGLIRWGQQTHLVDEVLLTTLQSLGLEKALRQAYRQCRDYPHFKFFLWVWFDAFRTLKFVHFMRDHYFPSWSSKDVMGWLRRKDTRGPARDASINLAALEAIVQNFVAQEDQLPLETGPTIALESM